MFSSNAKSTDIAVKINNEVIYESSEEKLLGDVFGKTLSFKAHLASVIRKQPKS